MVSPYERELTKENAQDNLQHFLHWMEVNGVQLRGCTLKPCEGSSEAGLGVFTTDGHPENGILMVSPLALAITPITALQDPLLGSVFAKLFEDGDVDDRLVVMLYLLIEALRGDSSFWAPYLKVLPTKFGMTICFSEEELLELKGTSLYRATKIQQASLKRHFYEKVKGLAETILASVGWVEREVEFEDFLWANCIFWTRALNAPFPQSIVVPKNLQAPPLLLEENEPRVVDNKAVVEGWRFDGQNPELMEKGQNGSPDFSLQSQQHGKVGLGRSEIDEPGDMPHKFSEEGSVRVMSVSNHCDVGSSNQPLSDTGTIGKPEPEATVWVELLDGMNQGLILAASKAHAVWEVDDQWGSTSGVQYSMYLVTGNELPSNIEVRINYGSKGNEELLYLYGFVQDKNPDDYLMVHFPKEALEHGICAEEKFLLLEEQKLSMRWLLSSSLLKDGYVNQQSNEASPNSDTLKHKQSSHNYSWSGHRESAHDLERQVFPEELMAALRIIAMTEEEVQSTTALLQELSEPDSERVPTAEDIRAAVWEVCGNAGALQVLQDLLTSKSLEIEEGTGSQDADAYVLDKDAEAQIEAAKKRQQGSIYAGDDNFIEENLMSRNKRACVVYRMGQKHLVKRFLQEAEHALQSWIT